MVRVVTVCVCAGVCVCAHRRGRRCAHSSTGALLEGEPSELRTSENLISETEVRNRNSEIRKSAKKPSRPRNRRLNRTLTPHAETERKIRERNGKPERNTPNSETEQKTESDQNSELRRREL